MSATSSLANKQFSFTSGSTSKSDSALDPREQRAIITKPYDAGSHATPGQDAKFFTPASVAISPNTTDTNKSFTTSRADLGRNQAALLASTTSSDQGRTANLGTGNTSTFASPLNSKTFGGPEAEAVRRDLSKLNDGLMQIKDLPNRPLTIDEVRALINHGVKPNTDVAPEPPTKPLNDPNYKPEPSPAPPEPAPAPEEDKDDPVPSPGTMAQPPPENSEPLPQH